MCVLGVGWVLGGVIFFFTGRGKGVGRLFSTLQHCFSSTIDNKLDKTRTNLTIEIYTTVLCNLIRVCSKLRGTCRNSSITLFVCQW